MTEFASMMADTCDQADGGSKLLKGLTELFPTPMGIEQVRLLDSLIEILEAAPWLAPLLGDGFQKKSMESFRAELAKDLNPLNSNTSVQILTGAFGRAGAVIGRGVANSSREMNLVRGMYWLAIYRWWIQGKLDHPSGEALAAALRGTANSIQSRANVAFAPTLIAMETVNDLGGAVAAMALVANGDHKALCEAWQKGLHKVLDIPSGDIKSPLPFDSAQPLTVRKVVTGTISRRAKLDRDEALNRLKTPSRTRLIRHQPVSDQLPTEPNEEFSLPIDLVIVPGMGTGEVPYKYALYQARQAVWGGNPLLLTTHVETLTAVNYGAALRWLVAQLSRSDLATDEAVGSAVCLLKSITGRTTLGVQALCSSLTAESTSPFFLNLAKGEITAPPYWRTNGNNFALSGEAPGYFQASSEQKKFLEIADGEIALPLPRHIHQTLRKIEATLNLVAKLETSSLDSNAADAAAIMALELGVEITVATLRRSLGAQITEVSGDIALAQLICGDSFGLPSSQQHYYAPRRKDIAQAYKKAVAVHFERSATSSLLRAGLRVGSHLLVTPKFARLLAQSSFDGSSTYTASDTLPVWLSDHRKQLDHLARMIIATTGHRPAQALFDLTLNDFDIETGLALYRDKCHDEAHDPRLVALPAVLCKQISSFVRHLEHLATEKPETGEAIRSVLLGQMALLIDFDVEGNAIGLDLSSLKARSPAAWNELPWNWSRTYLRTRGLEMGASAFSLACQLGHFDVVGYPYCQQSPTIPLEVVRELRAPLDRLASAQGWKVISEPLETDEGYVCSHLPPLTDWGARLAEAEQIAARNIREWEKNLRRYARHDRESAVEKVLQHAQLVESGVSAAYLADNVINMPTPLDEVAVFEIRSDLAELAGDDGSLAIVLLRAFRKILRCVEHKTRVCYPPVPLPILLRRPLENPFFSGSCAALRQMRTLREHLVLRGQLKRPERTYLLQVARTAEALVLFGHIDRVEQLLAILEARRFARSSSKIPDLMLVPLPDHSLVGLRGIAALALACLKQAFPDEPLPARKDIVAALEDILPSWAVINEVGQNGLKVAGDLLDRLCSTTAVVNRYELSSAARFALDPHCGATNANIDEQLAFIDEDEIGPIRQETTVAPLVEQCDHITPSENTPRSVRANRQYLELCRIIPTPHKDLKLPLTRVDIPANQINKASTRYAVVAELDAYLKQTALWPIVRMLASWIRSEAIRQTGSKSGLADSTLSTYLTRIGRRLVQTLGEAEFSDFSEEIFEDAFAYCIDASEDARHKVAAALLSFHAHCNARWDLPELDLGFVYAELDQERHRADAAMILPCEREAAITQLNLMAWESKGDSLENVRQARLAHVVAYPVAWGGCRINEALGLQARDIGSNPDGSLWTRIRSNRRRRLKTLAASRRIVYRASEFEQRHRGHVINRVEDVRRQTDRRPEAAYLISDTAIKDGELSSEEIKQAFRHALAGATGRSSERLHRLRHLIANELIRDVALSHQDREWIGTKGHHSSDTQSMTPRDLAWIANSLGHAHWRTTLQTYLHLPWLLVSRSDDLLRKNYFKRTYVAGALGYTPALLDEILRKRKVDRVSAWFDYFRSRRIQPSLPSIAVTNHENSTLVGNDFSNCATVESAPASDLLKSGWATVKLGNIVALASKVRDLESAMRSVGAPMDDVAALIQVASRWEFKLGLRLLPACVGGVERSKCPKRAVRRLREDQQLEKLWSEIDRADLSDQVQYKTLINDFYTWLQPSKRHQITLPIESAKTLSTWLGNNEIDNQQIQMVEVTEGIVEVSVRRSLAPADSRYSGLSLRRILAVIGMAMELKSAL